MGAFRLLLMAVVVAFLFCCLGSPAQARVHSWVDEQGVTHFSQKRPEQKQRGADAPHSTRQDSGQKRPQAQPLPAGKGPVFMWKVSADDNFAYLLGSMHYAQEGIYPLDPRITAAFEQCRVLAVESDVEGKQAEIQALTIQLGMYPEGDSLEKHISSRTQDLLKELGAWNPMYMRFKPWLLAMQLQSQKFLEKGFDHSQGLDRHFLLKARKQGLQVKELEQAAETLKIFVDISEDNEDEFLYYSLLELDRFDEVVPKLGRYWKAGDAAGMRELLFYELSRRPEFKDLGRRLFDERNVKMARKVEQYLESGVPHFVVVGAGHLVGDTGVPELLKAKGFEVEQVGAGD